MSLVPSLLRAIVTVDGDALVLQAGERPYVALAGGQINLSSGGMTADAVSDVIGQLLPPESQQILTQFGAVQHDIADLHDFPGEQFRIVATNDGTVLGVEIRRAARSAAPMPTAPRVDHSPSAPAAQAAAPAPDAVPAAHADRVSPPEIEPALLERLLRRALDDGATALYLSTGLAPRLRLDDEMATMGGMAALTAAQIEAILRRAPETTASADPDHREWFWDFPALGRVRCASYRDTRGLGLVLRVVPTTAPTARQVGLSKEIEALVARHEGLVLLASPRGRSAGSSLAALIDLINRTRRVHLVSVEREVTALHQSDIALISQRESGRSPDRALACARAALREDPDVLAIDALQTADLLSLAMDAAQSGRLVLGALRGGTVAGVLADLAALYPAAQRPRALVSMARVLTAVAVETESTAAETRRRHLLMNAPEVAALVADGRFNEIARLG